MHKNTYHTFSELVKIAELKRNKKDGKFQKKYSDEYVLELQILRTRHKLSLSQIVEFMKEKHGFAPSRGYIQKLIEKYDEKTAILDQQQLDIDNKNTEKQDTITKLSTQTRRKLRRRYFRNYPRKK